MDIRQLRYFVGVAEAASFSRASLRMNVAQSALSLHIRRIEEDLGVDLFIREPKGVRLTSAGVKLLDHANIILRQLALAQDELKADRGMPAGTVAIGVPSGASRILVNPLLEAVHSNLPRVTIRIVEAMTGYLRDWLSMGRLHMAVTYARSDAEGAEPILAQEDLHLVTPTNFEHPAATITLDEIAKLPLLLPTGSHSPASIIGEVAHSLGVTIKIELEIDSLWSILDQVANGHGFSILAPSAFLPEWSAGRVRGLPIVQPIISRTARLTVAHKFADDAATQAVARQIAQTCSQLVQSGDWPRRLPNNDRRG